MLKKLGFLFLALLCFNGIKAQYSRYIVRFTNKSSSSFTLSNPSAYLGPRALERRNRYGIAIDSVDLPVTPRYLDSIRSIPNVNILSVSKWLNQVAIQTNDPAAITRINLLPFVQSTDPIAARHAVSRIQKKLDTRLTEIPETPSNNRINGYYNYGMSNGQVTIHQGDFLHNHGFRGQQMQVAILDAGFYNYQTLPTFDSLRNNNQVLGTWDFVANEASVNEDNSHGMHCLSTMAANLPGRFVGTSPGASFYLFRTEDVSSEYPIEEHYWASGAERADSLGVDIISVSLGYTQFDDAIFDHTYADLNGNTTLIARAANHASSRGMLVVVAAGNEGNGSWHYISSPADADSVLTVGAVDTTGRVAGFSGYGPNSSNQVKPDVAAVGWLAVVANGNTGQPAYSNGTSFACPNMAGIATCLWQAFPEASNNSIRQALRESSTRYGNPDDRVGYGIPDAKKAFVILQKKTYLHQSTVTDCIFQLSFDLKADNSMTIDLEKKNSADTAFQIIHTFNGNSAFTLNQFTYSDGMDGEVGSINTYRLVVHIGTDTSFVLDSMVHTVPQCVASAGNDVQVVPNPIVHGSLQVKTISETAVSVRLLLHNSAGQKMQEYIYTQPAGRKTSSFPVTHMAPGVYFLTAYYNNDRLKTVRLIIR